MKVGIKLKKEIIIKLLFIAVLVISLSTNEIYARGGGGSSSGSSSSGSSGSSSTGGGHSSKNNSRTAKNNKKTNPIAAILTYCMLGGIALALYISRIIPIKKAGIKTKNKMKNTSWNYKKIDKRIRETYYAIQNAWTNNNMEIAREYMTDELYENFKTKLEWMELKNRKNILKNIRLLQAYPVSLTDEVEDIDDKMWVYIKGKMIDYIIDTKVNEIIDGNTVDESFVEYWLFSKNVEGKWVLEKILQEDEFDRVILEK